MDPVVSPLLALVLGNLARDLITKGSEKTRVPADKIDETIRSLSEHLGWDITKGVGK